MRLKARNRGKYYDFEDIEIEDGIIKNANKKIKEKNMSLKLEAKKAKLEAQISQTLEKVANLKNQLKETTMALKAAKKKK